MCYFLFSLVSTNPAHGPEFLGAVIDCFITALIAYAIIKRIKERRTKR